MSSYMMGKAQFQPVLCCTAWREVSAAVGGQLPSVMNLLSQSELTIRLLYQSSLRVSSVALCRRSSIGCM